MSVTIRGSRNQGVQCQLLVGVRRIKGWRFGYYHGFNE